MIDRCNNCGRGLGTQERFYVILNIFIRKADKNEFITIKKAIEIIDEVIHEEYLHLSATELLLLRPDKISSIFEKYCGYTVYSWGFYPVYVCDKCFQFYCEEVPLR